ncbi:hypothetical protein JRK39_003541 [Vibrio cholerae]|nr:hypothetical protein [Vibrio cholerae]
MNEKLIQKVLAMICKDFKARKKTEALTIESYRFDAFLFAQGELASFFEKKGLLMEMDSILRILEGNRYITYANQEFSLTELGYEIGTESRLGRLLKWLNRNPGLAIIISMLSLVVSVIALIVSIKS